MSKSAVMTSGFVAAIVGATWLVSVGAAEAQDVVKIAAGAPLTGPLAKQGQEVANAVKLAVEEWNAKGGVLGKQIEVLEADDQGNPQVGVAAAEKVVADPAVMGAIWGITSVTCIPVSEILEKDNLVMISPGCTNPKVTDRGLKSVNRLCARDDLQGPAGIVFAVDELGAQKVAVFDDGTTGPRGVADEVEKKGKELGVDISRYAIRSGDKDFRAILGTLPKDIDLIYASLWAPDAALLVKQLPDVGLDTRVIVAQVGVAVAIAKQVADFLGEKPTKLYHHVDALERVGLIALSRTRQNRGTVEKYYLAVARAFQADSSAFHPKERGGTRRARRSSR